MVWGDAIYIVKHDIVVYEMLTLCLKKEKKQQNVEKNSSFSDVLLHENVRHC